MESGSSVFGDVMELIIGKTTVTLEDNGMYWVSGMAVDADGSPIAYHPSGKGLDATANAGHPGNWWGVVTDNGQPDGNPIVQGTNDIAPGYYVSPTSLCDKSKKAGDPAKYVDSVNVPYISLPPEARHFGGIHFGDLAWVCNKPNGMNGPAIFADGGPKGKLGEGSVMLATSLGINPDPRHGGIGSGIAWVVFPGSTLNWPSSVKDIHDLAYVRLVQWGGLDRLKLIAEQNKVQ